MSHLVIRWPWLFFVLEKDRKPLQHILPIHKYRWRLITQIRNNLLERKRKQFLKFDRIFHRHLTMKLFRRNRRGDGKKKYKFASRSTSSRKLVKLSSHLRKEICANIVRGRKTKNRYLRLNPPSGVESIGKWKSERWTELVRFRGTIGRRNNEVLYTSIEHATTLIEREEKKKKERKKGKKNTIYKRIHTRLFNLLV